MITKLMSFAGEAEVLGQVHFFNYDGSASLLVIHGVKDHSHALAVLDQLSAGSLAGVTLPEARPAKAPKTSKNGVEKPAGAAAHAAIPQQFAEPHKPEPVEDHQAEHVTTSPPASELAPAVAGTPQPAVGDFSKPALKLVEPAPGALATAAVDAAVAELAEENRQAEEALPVDVVEAKRMLPIVTYLRGKGMTDVDAIVKGCEAIKSQVPILQRVKDLRDRVERTLESFFPAGEDHVGDVAGSA